MSYPLTPTGNPAFLSQTARIRSGPFFRPDQLKSAFHPGIHEPDQSLSAGKTHGFS